jgi:hypothetical protein
MAHAGKGTHTGRARLCLLAVALAATTAGAQIPASAFLARRAAAVAGISEDMLIVPARASFLADDHLGLVQAADFQYLTGLDELVGAVLVLDGAASTFGSERHAARRVARRVVRAPHTMRAAGSRLVKAGSGLSVPDKSSAGLLSSAVPVVVASRPLNLPDQSTMGGVRVPHQK